MYEDEWLYLIFFLRRCRAEDQRKVFLHLLKVSTWSEYFVFKKQKGSGCTLTLSCCSEDMASVNVTHALPTELLENLWSAFFYNWLSFAFMGEQM